MEILLRALLFHDAQGSSQKRCLSSDASCVYVSACCESSLGPSFWHVLSYSWLPVTDANSGRTQGYYRNTNFLHSRLACSYFKTWLYEHIYCSWNCLKIQSHWTTKTYSLIQHQKRIQGRLYAIFWSVLFPCSHHFEAFDMLQFGLNPRMTFEFLP